MSRKYKFTDQDKLYFVSFAVINWIDLFPDPGASMQSRQSVVDYLCRIIWKLTLVYEPQVQITDQDKLYFVSKHKYIL